MGRLSSHVLDTASGRPARGMRLVLSVLDGASWRVVKSLATNADGRTDEPLLTGDALAPGRYQIEFHVGEYYRALGQTLPEPAFLDVVPIRFGIADAGQHYHVPLLCTPWSYATYRGS